MREQKKPVGVGTTSGLKLKKLIKRLNNINSRLEAF